jgi:hypothetical protein
MSGWSFLTGEAGLIRILRRAAFCCAAAFLMTGASHPPAVDFSGIWMPEAGADTLSAETLPLTEKGRAALAAFDPLRNESTRFCMPYGTPRNILSTAPYPIEILQRPEQITIIFDRLGDVRRIFTDGRDHPQDPWPTWLGHSTARWEGHTLVIDTVAMTPESILTDDGLPHSEQMHISERLSIIGRDRFQDEITITDPVMYEKPFTVVRTFHRAPEAQMSEGSAICLLDQWRDQLEARNRALADQVMERDGETAP